VHDSFLHHDDEQAAAEKVLASAPGQVSAVVYLGGRWVGLDLLAGPGLFRAWPRLRSGYVADAISQESKPWHPLDAGTVLGGSSRAWPRLRRRWASAKSTA
jgi:hypothetical protein